MPLGLGRARARRSSHARRAPSFFEPFDEPVVRTVAVREDQTLEQVHEALRLAFGWADPPRTIFQTPEEYEEWKIRSEATDRMLRDRIKRIEAELRAKDPNYRGIDYWIEQVRAERAAHRKPA